MPDIKTKENLKDQESRGIPPGAIVQNSDEPFKTKGGAFGAIRLKKLNEAECSIIEVDGGFAILEKKKKLSHPWDSSGGYLPDYTRLPKSHEGYEVHFCNHDQVDTRIEEGYRFINIKDYGVSAFGQEGHYKKNGQYPMEIDIEGAISRRALESKLTKLRGGDDMSKVKEVVTNMNKKGVGCQIERQSSDTFGSLQP